MPDRRKKSVDLSRLRKAAEEILEKKQSGIADADEADLDHLLHELEVNRLELEIQNEELRRSTKELEATRNEYYDLFDAAPIGFIIIDEKGAIDRSNQAASRMLTRNRRPMAGHLFSSWVHREDQGVFFSYLHSLSAKKNPSPQELRLVRKDGRLLHIHLEASAVNDREGHFTHWRLALVDISERKKYENALQEAYNEMEEQVRHRTAELEARNAQLARLSGELTLAEHRERQRLAKLLHDDIQQLLSGGRMYLEMLAKKAGLEDDPAYRNAHKLLTESLETSRTLSSELSSPVLFQQGLGEALHWLARWTEKTHKLHVHAEVEDNLPALPEELRILLFQSVRELLFNVVKHAQTDSARVVLQRREDQVQITVSDAGAGFEPSGLQQAASQEKFGLLAIEERLDLLGGRMDIEKGRNLGTSITLTTPLDPSLYARKDGAMRAADEIRPFVSDPETALQPSSEGKIRVLLADDHAVMRNGLSSLLSSQSDIEIAGEAADGEEAVDMARRIRPDVILMDISMPRMDGLEATRRIHAEMPEIRILGLSMYEPGDHAPAMKRAGAEGYLNKSGDTQVLLSAIRGEQV